MTNKSLNYTNQLSEIKKKFLKYYREIPIQKLAAKYIEKDEDTITNWKKRDPVFSDQLGRAKSEWVLEKVSQIKDSRWLLERITPEYFGKTTTNEPDNNPELEEWIAHVRKILRPNEDVSSKFDNIEG